MGRLILCSSDIFWGDQLAFCMHHLQQHRVDQRPPAFMDEVATMLSPSPKDIWCSQSQKDASTVGKQRRDLTRKWTILWTTYKWQMNPWLLRCRRMDFAAECLSQHAPFGSFRYPEGTKALIACFSFERHPSCLLIIRAVVFDLVRPIIPSKSIV